MGCNQSSVKQNADSGPTWTNDQTTPNSASSMGDSYGGYDDYDDYDAPPMLTEAEIKARIMSGSGSMTLPDFKYTLKYAWQSQRGYYPENLNKANQDACLIVKNFNKNPNIGYFGVYDGHGQAGDKCSNFVRTKISTLLLESVRRTNANSPQFDSGYSRAYQRCNELMHRQASFDDSHSGTTAVSAWIEGTTVKVANIGDSRAIVAQREPNGRLRAIALSQDQTPYRKDERERCKKFGARIMTMDQRDGRAPLHENWGVNLGEEIDDGGDPPRIWSQDGRGPGTAFTRSIGDAVAERLGVVAEPEVLTFELDERHEFLVVASDGVWEFLTSQMVVDRVTMYPNPADACRVVVHESYNLWLRHEIRTDDITMIVVQIKDLKRKAGAAQKQAGDPAQSFVQRPVRRRRKREMVVDSSLRSSTEEDEEYDIVANTVEKTPAEIQSLTSAVESNFLFVHLDAEQRRNIFNVMQRVTVAAGDTVIRQGDEGDRFFVVESGSFEALVSAPNDASKQISVMRYDGDGSFGELALMYGKPRAASVRATTAGSLWALDRRAFRRLVMKSSNKSLITTLREVGIFKALKRAQLQTLADALAETSYKSGSFIIRQGEQGDKFYVIQSGSVKCTIQPADGGKVKEVLRLTAGSYFGERALLSNQPRAANVIALGKVKCLQISRRTFEDVLGPLQSIIEADQKRRESQGRKVTRKASIQRKGANIAGIQHSTHLDFQYMGIFHTDDLNVSDAGVVKHNRGKTYNMVRYNKCQTVAKQQEELVLRNKMLMGAMEDSCRNISDLVATYVGDNCLYLLLDGSSEITMHLDDLFAAAEGGQAIGETEARFYAACVINALQVLHKNGIVYRMIDPNCLGVDVHGYVMLYDFLLAKDLRADGGRTNTLCGSKEYFAPEMVTPGAEHGVEVDIWALGIMIYDALAGTCPFSGEQGEASMYDQIINHRTGKLSIANVSADCNNLINKLIHPSAKARKTTMKSIKSHPFFRGFDWAALESGSLAAPFQNVVESETRRMFQGRGESKGRAGGSSSQVASVAYAGDSSWFDEF